MYIKYLETFLAAAGQLNFGETARQLNYSQSTISEHIHCIEEYLGVKLFERIGRRVFLTPQGKKLLPYAERMVKDAEKLKTLFINDELIAGTLTVGAAETLCAFWLPPLLKEYRVLYPQVQIHIKVGNCIDFPQWLQQNWIDVAFGLNDESAQPQLRQVTLFHSATVFIAAPDYPLAKTHNLNLASLAGQTLLLPEGYCGYPMDLKDLLEAERVRANTIMEFGSIESIKQCVKNGLGISLLPRIAVESELERGEMVVLELAAPAIPIVAQMIFHRDKWMSPALSVLEKLIMAKQHTG